MIQCSCSAADMSNCSLLPSKSFALFFPLMLWLGDSRKRCSSRAPLLAPPPPHSPLHFLDSPPFPHFPSLFFALALTSPFISVSSSALFSSVLSLTPSPYLALSSPPTASGLGCYSRLYTCLAYFSIWTLHSAHC